MQLRDACPYVSEALALASTLIAERESVRAQRAVFYAGVNLVQSREDLTVNDAWEALEWELKQPMQAELKKGWFQSVAQSLLSCLALSGTAELENM